MTTDTTRILTMHTTKGSPNTAVVAGISRQGTGDIIDKGTNLQGSGDI